MDFGYLKQTQYKFGTSMWSKGAEEYKSGDFYVYTYIFVRIENFGSRILGTRENSSKLFQLRR